MGYMKNLDLSERFSKLSDAQKNAVINIKTGGTEKIHPATYKALESRGLIVKNGEVWELEEGFNREIMEAINRPEPREEDGDFTPENIARAIEDIDAESVEETEEVSAFQHLINEGVYHPATFSSNRESRRRSIRNRARRNRARMYAEGKRIKKYGVLIDPAYAVRQLSA